MIQQLIYLQDELPLHLKCQILSFLRIKWTDGFVGVNRLRDWISPSDLHPVSILLVEQDILISHTEVVWKYLEHNGEQYKAYGLSGVFTYPAFRNQGYGHQIVKLGTEYIEASDADIGILHCAYNLKTFYTACGWIAMENMITLIGSQETPIVSDELSMMRFISEKGRDKQKTFKKSRLYFGEDIW